MFLPHNGKNKAFWKPSFTGYIPVKRAVVFDVEFDVGILIGLQRVQRPN